MFGSKLVCRPSEELTMEERLDLPLTELLKVRTVNMLEEDAGIRFVRELLKKTQDELMQIPNFGRTTLKEVLKALDNLGLECKDTNTTHLTTAEA